MIGQIVILVIVLAIGIIVWKLMNLLMFGAFLFAVFLAFSIASKFDPLPDTKIAIFIKL